MAPPSFRLQSVLDYRRNLVHNARLQLSGLQTRCAAEEERLSELRANERDVIAELYEKQRVVVNMPDVMRLNEHLNVLGQRISNQWSVVQRLRSEMERARGTLLDLTKEMKALGKLEERQSEAAVWEAIRAERIETGEIAARRHRIAAAR